MKRRTLTRRGLIAVLASVNLVVGAFGSYAFWTRHGAPTFARGGAFGPEATPSATARASASTTAKAAASRARTAHRTQAPAVVPVAGRAGAVSAPRPGTYRFAGSGREEIQIAGGSPCSWNITDVTDVVKETSEGIVFDWTYSPQRQQRNIMFYSSDGIYTTFVGAAVTCVVRKTDNETYERPVRRIPIPLSVGHAWETVALSSGRREDITGKVVAHRTFTVPAGSFDAYQLEMAAKISGNQTGMFRASMWFAPALGFSIWEHLVTDVTQSSAHFRSDFTIKLSALPS